MQLDKPEGDSKLYSLEQALREYHIAHGGVPKTIEQEQVDIRAATNNHQAVLAQVADTVAFVDSDLHLTAHLQHRKWLEEEALAHVPRKPSGAERLYRALISRNAKPKPTTINRFWNVLESPDFARQSGIEFVREDSYSNNPSPEVPFWLKSYTMNFFHTPLPIFAEINFGFTEKNRLNQISVKKPRGYQYERLEELTQDPVLLNFMKNYLNLAPKWGDRDTDWNRYPTFEFKDLTTNPSLLIEILQYDTEYKSSEIKLETSFHLNAAGTGFRRNWTNVAFQLSRERGLSLANSMSIDDFMAILKSTLGLHRRQSLVEVV